ncbi:conopeptide [Plakobranchus ocellatus]|uniref:Conopeptide n=1 Tax=Plakobranchus ocellatus TaxID=259542 RepID=A0AAV3ZEF9_9GAST|nr:conopeptide [Plakobranchus ocellatus]
MFAKRFTFAFIEGLRVIAQVVYASSRPCKRYEGDGCSIPYHLPFFYKKQFTKSCDRHDICYHCGVAYGIPRSQCDNAFRNNTLATCKSNYLLPSQQLTAPAPPTVTRRNTKNEHKHRLINTMEKYGAECLKSVIQKEINAFIQNYRGEPSKAEFLAWVFDHEVHVRMLAEWAKILDEYLQQAGPIYPKKIAKQIKIKKSWREKELKFTLFLMITWSDGLKTEEDSVVEEIPSDLTSQPRLKRVSSHQLDHSDEGNEQLSWWNEIKEYFQATNQTVSFSALKRSDTGYLRCNLASEMYYQAVSRFGAEDYHKVAQFYCHQSFVKKCLPPQP